MNKILLELENRRSEAKKGGGKERILSQHKKGKLTARETPITKVVKQTPNISIKVLYK